MVMPQSRALENEVLTPRHDTVSLALSLAPIFARSPAMQAAARLIERVAGKNIDVLLLGESGTGKELVAKLLHRFREQHTLAEIAPGAQGEFVAVNLAALPATLIEAELFGVERGAFTGATQTRVGRFEQANGGTLFLDDIGELPLELQPKILRALQERQITRVGGTRPIDVSTVVIAATHRSLIDEVARGRFREDLFYRLNVFPIELPPLRKRPEDIAELARHFAATEGPGLRGYPLTLDDAALTELCKHDWPGNVRELKNAVIRAAILTTQKELTASDFSGLSRRKEAPQSLPKASTSSKVEALDLMAMPLEELVAKRLGPFVAKFCEGPTGDLYDLVLAQVERALFRLVLDRTSGNQLRAAEVLGINRNTLRTKLRALGVEVR